LLLARRSVMLQLVGRVGRGCANRPEDVKAAHAKLVAIGTW
jgi:hypothetical protein